VNIVVKLRDVGEREMRQASERASESLRGMFVLIDNLMTLALWRLKIGFNEISRDSLRSCDIATSCSSCFTNICRVAMKLINLCLSQRLYLFLI
jgi:hypothetical protein